MADKSTSSESGRSGPAPFFEFGKEQTEAMLHMQKELMDAYEQASHAWVSRVKSEADLWTELASKLSATRSIPEAMEAYQSFIAQRMQMAADDGRRQSEEAQAMMQRFTSLRSNGRPTGST
jgi:Phasin protein